MAQVSVVRKSSQFAFRKPYTVRFFGGAGAGIELLARR